MKKNDISIIQKNVLSWYKTHQRDLPRRKTTDPYQIWISEVMSQQTQVQRVIPYYHKRLATYPTITALAQASTQNVLTLWSGLGFNARALRTKECAQYLVKKHDGHFPQQYEELLKLPGIGPYTASAIMAFAWNEEIPVIDTNIRRVLIFLLKLEKNITDQKLKIVAQDLIPLGKSRVRHNALMDYGALILTSKKTKIRPRSRQSRFEGSDRQVRGRILKHLTQEKSPLSKKEVSKEFPQKDIPTIIQKLTEDQLVKYNAKTETITLP